VYLDDGGAFSSYQLSVSRPVERGNPHIVHTVDRAGATDAVSSVARTVGVSIQHVQEGVRSKVSVPKVASDRANFGEIGQEPWIPSRLKCPRSFRVREFHDELGVENSVSNGVYSM
jgi:hypothetical protein